MSIKLDLCRLIRKKCGIAGTGPTTTIDQIGEYELVCDWFDEAYNYIQTLSNQWAFLRANFSIACVSGTQEYSVTGLADWLVGDVRCYLSSTDDEQRIFYIPWLDFKRAYLFGGQRSTAGRPTYFTIQPDNSMVLWPIPDDIYTITGEQYTTPDIITADAGEPIFPERFHMMIVWRALNIYGADYAEPDKEAKGWQEYDRLLDQLKIDQGPKFRRVAPLA